MKHVEIYPSKILQPNENQSSGLQGKCFKEIRRDGSIHNVNCNFQKDPKYHHKWSNTTNLKSKNSAAQCGRPSRYHCSHATYYGIKGYRNTCPIAGVSGTYTMPATLRLGFDLDKEGLISGVKVHKVIVKLEHRCTGVDVGSGAETIVWGPNFYGFEKYSNRKVLKFKFVDSNGKNLSKTVSTNSKGQDYPNPPLSKNYSGVSAEFTDVSFNDLKNGYLDIIYGNNLSTNPGNIYIRNVKIIVYYEDATPYISGEMNKDTIYYSEDLNCDTEIDFTIRAGYKFGSTEINPNKAPKNLQDNIKYVLPKGLTDSNISDGEKSSDGKTVVYTLSDTRGILGEHTIKFYLKDDNKKAKTFNYNVKEQSFPEIIIPASIKKNTNPNGITGIIAQNGCSSKIDVYLNNNKDLLDSFSGSDLQTGQNNLIKKSAADRFYKKLSSLNCGTYTLFIKRRTDDTQMIQKTVRIEPYDHVFEFYQDNERIYSLERTTGSTASTIKIKYMSPDSFQVNPKFKIHNPTSNNSDIIFSPTNKGDSINISISGSRAGLYQLKITEEQSCPSKETVFNINIKQGDRTQHYDKLFVRVEDSTSVDYDYLVAWEGDTIKQPVGISYITIGQETDDIKICAEQSVKAGISQIKTTQLQVKNTSKEDIQNLYLELNVLDENQEVTTDEWIDIHGVFFNFKQNLMDFNSHLGNNINVINLTKDNDFVDEENVYLKINKIEAGQTIPIDIPFGSSFEKDIYLQVLLFETPLKLYHNCTNEFDYIHIQVYDSLLTELSIDGDLDIQNKTGNCYDTSNGVTYSIRNIDSSNLAQPPRCLIVNNPKLIPYQIEYDSVTYTNTQFNESSAFGYENIEAEEDDIIRGAVVNGYIKFPNLPKIELSGATDHKGQISFVFDIPEKTGKSYTFDDILEISYFDFEGDYDYKWCKIGSLPEIKQYNLLSPNLNETYFKKLYNYIRYKPGERMIIQFELHGKRKYTKNQLVFKPDITKSGDIDSIKVFYKVCDIDKGIFETTFKTDPDTIELIENEITKDIYCGINTDLHVTTELKERVIEKKDFNVLKIHVKNSVRNNKDITVTILENPQFTPDKYVLKSYEIETGTIVVDNNKIIWAIDSMEKNESVTATLKFEGSIIGLSEIKTKVKDFLNGGE